jgi:hypothetical protein
MSAQILSSSNQFSKLQMAVSFRFLLSLYAIVPVCLLLQIADQYVFNAAFREMLPNSPTQFLLFQVLFGTPHIIASNLLLVSHREYLLAFKGRIIAMSLFIILFFGVGSLYIPYRTLYIMTACWTVYHVLKQQHGIAKAVCRLPNWAFYLQLWLSVGAGIFTYIGIFLNLSLTPEQAQWVQTAATILVVFLLLSTLVCQKRAPSGVGRWFLWANTLLVLVSWYLYAEAYYFLAILMPRLVHDITAYSFYVSHDVNRQSAAPMAGVYRWASACRLPVALVLPVLSFLLTYLLQVHGDNLINFITQTLFGVQFYKVVTLGFLGYLALMHYYTEAFVWSAGSPLRRYIAFAK